jgi:hypothetical protein
MRKALLVAFLTSLLPITAFAASSSGEGKDASPSLVMKNSPPPTGMQNAGNGEHGHRPPPISGNTNGQEDMPLPPDGGGDMEGHRPPPPGQPPQGMRAPPPDGQGMSMSMEGGHKPPMQPVHTAPAAGGSQ